MKPNPNLPSSPQYSGDDENTDAILITGVSPACSKSKSPEDRPSPPRMYSPEVDGMEVGGGSDEESSQEEQQQGTKRARSENDSIETYEERLSSTEPIAKKRRTQEPDETDKTSTASEPMQAHQNTGVRMLVNWTCEHLLEMNQGLPFNVGDTFSYNTFAHFRNALEQAVKANAPELVQKLLETGMQNCITDVLDQALEMANAVGAHDVIALLSTNSSSSSSSETTLPNVRAPEQGWQQKINPKWESYALQKIIEALKDQTNSTDVRKLLFGEGIENWPKGEFRAETFDYLEVVMKNLFEECGAVCLMSDENNLVLFSSDFDLDKFRQRLLHKQQQEQTALQNHEVNADNLSKSTALMIAVQWGDLPTVQKLLENGANPAAVNLHGTNALMFASSKGHSEIVSLLLPHPINIHIVDHKNYTALSYAIQSASLPVCQLLFNHGAMLDNEVVNPLHLAALHGNVEIYKLLIEKGADIHQVFDDKNTPLSEAAAAGHLDACKLLVSKGVDINYVDEYGLSILAWGVRSGSLELVEYLLAKGATHDNANDIRTPLCEAATFKKIDIVKILLAHGADVNRPDKLENTALFYSCREKSLEITDLLLQAGADVNIEDSDYETALVYAARGGSLEIVKLLISHGAKLFSDQHYGFQALAAAVRGGHIDIATHLLRMNVPTNNIAVAVGQKSLIIQSISPNYDENTDIAMLKLLLSYGASLRECDYFANDALMLALLRKKTSVIFFLLDQGIKIGQLNNSSQNALHIAMEALDDSLRTSTPRKKIDALILARLLANAQTQSDWLDLRKEAIQREQHPLTREIILLSHLWPFVIKHLPYVSSTVKVLDELAFDSFIQFAITASPDVLIEQKIDYMLSLVGICPSLIEHIRPYIQAIPQIKSRLFGNSLTPYPAIGLSFWMGTLATLEKIHVEHNGNWSPYKDELSDSLIFNILNQLAKIELNHLINFNINQEATNTAIVFEKLFETCFNFTVAAPILVSTGILPYRFPAYTAATGTLADALMRQGVYSALAIKIELAWQAAWSQFVGKIMISDSGSSSSSSSSSSNSSMSSRTAYDPDDFFGIYESDVVDEQVNQTRAPKEPKNYLDSPQGQDMLKTFRHELRLAVDQVGGNILDLPKGATEVPVEAAKIYADLMFRQLHMLKQFIDPDQSK